MFLPKAFSTASASNLSLSGVEVPWSRIAEMSEGRRPAVAMTFSIARLAPTPLGLVS